MKLLLSFLLISVCSGFSTHETAAIIQLVSEKIQRSTAPAPAAKVSTLPRTLKSKPGPKDSCSKLVAYELGWENWQEIIETNSAIFRPKNDRDLQKILQKSQDNQCVVRMSGARGSHDGLVMQRLEENTVLISLADHITSTREWQDKMIPDTNRVRIGAGKTFYDLTKLIRPEGFLLRTRTAGRYFTIGGVVANMVHGGSKDSGFLHEDVTGLLVMLANGDVMEVTDEDELKYWRNSAGLLGVILAVEFEVIQDTGFQMDLQVKTYDMTSEGFFSSIVTDIFTAVAMNDHLEFFFNPYDGELLILAANMLAASPPDSARLQEYRTAAENLINANEQYDIAYRGAPKYPITSACDLIPTPFCLDSQATAYIMVGVAHDFVESDWATAKSTVNDGYYSTSVTKFHSLDTFAPASTFPQMLGQFLGLFQNFAQSGSSPYYPTGGLQFRFVNPSSKSGILSPVPPIADLEAQFLAENFFPLPALPGAPSGYVALHYTGLTNINDEYSDIFLQQLESLYLNTPLNPSMPSGPGNPLIPVKAVHLGKEWGYGPSPVSGMKHTYYPFSDSSLLTAAYAGRETDLANFNAKRLELDPEGLFSGGAMMRWLDPTNHPLSYFEPRALEGQSCADTNVFYQDASCLSACCGASSLECVRSGLPSGSDCEDSCQCLSSVCEAESSSKPKPKPKPSPKGKPAPMKCA
jgi:hypothetical protein